MNTLQRWRQSAPLSLRLTAPMLVVAAAAMALIFYNLSQENRREIEALQTQNLINTSQELARSLDNYIDGELARIGNLATARAVQQFALATPAQRSALFTPLLADFTNFLASDSAYRAVLLLDTDGQVIAATDGGYVGRSFADHPFFQNGFTAPTMSDPGLSTLDGQPLIWLSAPILAITTTRSRTASSPVGVIATAVAPTTLWQRVERVRIGENGYAIVVDGWGIRLAHGRDRNLIFRTLTPLAPADWSTLRASGRFGALESLADTNSQGLWDYLQQQPLPPLQTIQLDDGERVYESATRLTRRNWTVIAFLPAAEVLAPAQRVTTGGLAATLVVTALLAITVSWIARRMLRPVDELVVAARTIAGGDLTTPIRVHATGELNVLAENFETMRQRLLRSRNELADAATYLEYRVTQRTQELSALSEVVASASRTQSRRDLLHTALTQTLRVMGAEMAGIWMADASGALTLTASAGFDAQMEEDLRHYQRGEGLLSQVQISGVPMALEDIAQSPRLARAAVRERGLHGFAAVPLRIQGRVLGVLGVFSQSQQDFSPEAVALAESIGQQIALTLDNLALIDQVREQAQTMAAVQERERLAADIHDRAAQMIGYLYLQTDVLDNEIMFLRPDEIRQRIAQQRRVLDDLSREIRSLISQLQSTSTATTALDRVLQDEVEALRRELSLHVDLQLDGARTVPLTGEAATELARIVSEALRNAHRHGHARSAVVRFLRQDESAILTINDDGIGFDPAQPPSTDRKHFGLRVMAARAARLGGELKVNSAPGRGATIEVIWPLTATLASDTANEVKR